ncbi:hypothetical protein AVEN_29177-1 [Araneus ventricosus]|uniref:Uncharacterized protein n=1 Tax=Araneus ventricosus TaxID=182803 RepID=A0A4Y2AK26_ARAVE|nr:hypothetical protein AVEN_29177-1 [Araneus ventricosus]
MSLQDLYYNLRRNSIRTFKMKILMKCTLQRRSARNKAEKLRRARKRSNQLRQIVFILKLRFAVRNADMMQVLLKRCGDSLNFLSQKNLAKPTASSKKKCSDSATLKFDAFKRPVQRAVQQV